MNLKGVYFFLCQSLSQWSKTRTNVADTVKIPMYNYFAHLFPLYSTGHLLIPRPLSYQEVEQHFYSFVSYKTGTSMSSVVIHFMHAIHKCVQKVRCAKRGTFWFPWTEFRGSNVHEVLHSTDVRSTRSIPSAKGAWTLRYQTKTK